MTEENIELERRILAIRAYELYKKDWCATRGYSYADVCQADKDDVEFNGEMFVCREEFESAEFLDKEYMRYLLSNEDFGCYEKIFE